MQKLQHFFRSAACSRVCCRQQYPWYNDTVEDIWCRTRYLQGQVFDEQLQRRKRCPRWSLESGRIHGGMEVDLALDITAGEFLAKVERMAEYCRSISPCHRLLLLHCVPVCRTCQPILNCIRDARHSWRVTHLWEHWQSQESHTAKRSSSCHRQRFRHPSWTMTAKRCPVTRFSIPHAGRGRVLDVLAPDLQLRNI